VIRAVWAIVGVGLLGAAGVAGAVIVASSGGEEEVVQQPQSVSPTVAITPNASPTPAVTTPAPTPEVTSTPGGPREYTDAESGYSITYPAKWELSKAPSDAFTRDFRSGIDFVAEDGYRHAAIYVFENPSGLSLRDWILDHNPIFFDQPPQERTIAGMPALFSDKSLGLPVGHAYIARGDLVFEISGLSPAEFEELVSGFRFT
jgi:hypothetical protein